jgi:hypothetical protein
MDDDPEDAYLGQVASSSIYVGILGARYGRPLKSGYSATHAEYNTAVDAGLRISVWTAADGLDGPQRDFLDAVRVFHTTGTYASPDDLQTRVAARLRIIANETLSPWTKIGHVLVRATDISDDGRQIVVRTRVRNSSVSHALEQMRSQGTLNRSAETRISSPIGTSAVRVTGVSVAATDALTRDITITAEVLPADSPSPTSRVSVNGHSPDDLTEIGLRTAFFGDQNPLGNMGFMAQAVNALPQLNGLNLTEDAVEQLARLLVVEEVVGRLAAGHVTQFELGPIRDGARRLRLGWVPPRIYTNIAPEPRFIEGEVRFD